MSVIAFDGLTKRFGDVVAVNDSHGRARAWPGRRAARPQRRREDHDAADAARAGGPDGAATIDGQPYRDLDEPIRHIGAVLEGRPASIPGAGPASTSRVLAATAGLPDE